MATTTSTIDPKKVAAGAARVDTAAAKAYELIQRYAEVPDPYSDAEDNPWRNPQAMFEEMKVARGELVAAWNELNQSQENQQHDVSRADKDEEEKQQDEDFRAVYMDMITDAFADVLEDMRSNETEEIDVDVLVDCLQSGFDLLSVQDKEIFFQGIDDDEDIEDTIDDEENNIMTPHERRRVELGFDVQVSS